MSFKNKIIFSYSHTKSDKLAFWPFLPFANEKILSVGKLMFQCLFHFDLFWFFLCSSSENSAFRASTSFSIHRSSSLTDVLKYKDEGISNLKFSKSEGNISSTEFGISQEHEPSVTECTAQRLHIYIDEEELDDTVLLKLMKNVIKFKKRK